MDDDSAAAENAKEPVHVDERGERAFWDSLSAAGALYRWILASLVTLNGGALVALGNWHEAFTPGGLKGAAICFFWGCVAAVLAAMAGAAAIIFAGSGLASGRYKFAAFIPSDSGKDLKLREAIFIASPIIVSMASLYAFALGGIRMCVGFVGFPSAFIP